MGETGIFISSTHCGLLSMSSLVFLFNHNNKNQTGFVVEINKADEPAKLVSCQP